MAKVLTEQEVESIGRSGNTIVANRCCTKAKAEELDCTVTAPSGATSNQLITGIKGNMSNLAVSMAGWTYGGTATSPSVTGNLGGGTVTYTYKASGASSYSSTKPTNAGTHTVKASVAETTNYIAKAVTSTFTIAKATGSSGSVSNPVAQTYLTSSTYSYQLGISGATGTVTYPTSITVKKGSTIVSGWTCTSAGVVTVPKSTNTGSYTVIGNITVAAATNYNAVSATSKTWTVTINKATRSGAVSCSNVTFDSTVTATVSGNTESGTVTWGVTAGTGTATINTSGVVTPTKVGTVTITASVAATTNYAAYTATSKQITISAATIIIPTPISWTGDYDSNNHTATFNSVTGASITKYRRSTDDKTWTELTYNGGQTDPGKIYVLAYYTPDSNHTGGGWSDSATVTITGYKYVDLGLPSGTKWATQAVGSYYMYGKGTTKWSKGQTPYSGTENPLSESLDTAKLVWGGSWRMPTKTQCEELINNTTKTVASGGIKFTATNGNSITIPLVGYHEVNQDNLINNSTTFKVWTRTPYNSTLAYSLYGIISGSTVTSVTTSTGNKSDGYTIWAVK